MQFGKRSFSFKIALLIVIFIFVYSGVSFFFMIRYFDKHSLESLRNNTISFSKAIAIGLSRDILLNDIVSLQKSLSTITEYKGIGFACVVDGNKNILAHTFYPLVPYSMLGSLDYNPNAATYTFADYHNHKVLIVITPIYYGKLGYMILGQIIYSHARMWMIMGIIGIVSLIIMLALLFLTILPLIMKPITTTTAMLKDIVEGQGDLTKRIKVGAISPPKPWYEAREKYFNKYFGGKVSDDILDNYICFLDVGSEAPELGKEILCPTILAGKIKSCFECKYYKKMVSNEAYLLGMYFNLFVGQLDHMIGEIKKAASDIHFGAESLFAMADKNSKLIDDSVNGMDIMSSNMEQSMKGIDSIARKSEDFVNQLEGMVEKITTQSGHVEETAATINEMTTIMNNIEGITKRARDIMANVVKFSNESNNVLEQTINAIVGVEEASSQIKEISDIINGIAEQTNLLSMNASIEAAHAGSFGSGFAVVADEIRRLAENTAGHTKKIKGVVKNIEQRIKGSVSIVEKLRKNFDITIKVVGEGVSITDEINNAIVEELSSAKAISDAMIQLTQISQDTLTSANEIKEAAVDIVATIKEVREFYAQNMQIIRDRVFDIKEIARKEENAKMLAGDNKVIANKLIEFVRRFKTFDNLSRVGFVLDEQKETAITLPDESR